MQAELNALRADVALLRDKDAIITLQTAYGYYIDKAQWDEPADLFARDATLKIAARGQFQGQGRTRAYLHALPPPKQGTVFNHMHVQPRLFHTIRHGKIERVAWAEGTYENEYVKEDGAWKIKRLWWVPTFYTQIDGFDTAVFQTGPESTAFLPDAPSKAQELAPGRSFPLFHDRHPFTGRDVPITMSAEQT
jgi:SnoaL-like domain